MRPVVAPGREPSWNPKYDEMQGIDRIVDQAIHRFENLRHGTKAMHDRYVRSGTVGRRIVVTVGDDRGAGPRAVFGSPPMFELPIRFVEYIWAVSYYFVVIQEEIQVEEQNPNWNSLFSMTTPVRIRARRVFTWAMESRKGARNFPNAYPNPAMGEESGTPEALYCGMTNTVAIFALCHVLFHELGHLVGDHGAIAELRRQSDALDLDEDDRVALIGAETDADNFALSAMIHPEDSERTKFNHALGILTVIIATLFTETTNSQTRFRTHPSADERLRRALRFIELGERRHHDFVYQLASNALITYFDECGFDWSDSECASIEERFTDLISVVDRLSKS